MPRENRRNPLADWVNQYLGTDIPAGGLPSGNIASGPSSEAQWQPPLIPGIDYDYLPDDYGDPRINPNIASGPSSESQSATGPMGPGFDPDSQMSNFIASNPAAQEFIAEQGSPEVQEWLEGVIGDDEDDEDDEEDIIDEDDTGDVGGIGGVRGTGDPGFEISEGISPYKKGDLYGPQKLNPYDFTSGNMTMPQNKMGMGTVDPRIQNSVMMTGKGGGISPFAAGNAWGQFGPQRTGRGIY